MKANQPDVTRSSGDVDSLSAGCNEQTWMPIESAPKDGQKFLTWTSHHQYGIRIGICYERADHDDWLSHVDANGHSWKGGLRPTHWMPLPEAPK